MEHDMRVNFPIPKKNAEGLPCQSLRLSVAERLSGNLRKTSGILRYPLPFFDPYKRIY
jgi:hypothetical protein